VGVPEDTIVNFCLSHKISIYKKTSAKTGEGVDEVFQELGVKLLKKPPELRKVAAMDLSLEPRKNREKELCCT
jgi:hypothetical protein